MTTQTRNTGTRLLAPVGMLTTAALVALTSGCGGGRNSTQTPVVRIPTHFTTVDGPGGATTLNGISNAGTAVGFTTSNGANANFSLSGGAFTALNLGDPAGMANAVNTAGTVVGVANGNAFTLIGSKQTTLTPPGATASAAFGISDGGTIVGQFASGTQMPGFVDVAGTFKTVSPATATVTSVQGVNNKGKAIGFFSPDGVHQHGFTYDVNTQAVATLPDPSTARTQSGGLVLTQFLALNDNGEAVGYYQTTNGSQYGFLFNLTTQAYTYLDDPQAAPVSGVQVTQITGVTNSGEICGFFIDAAGVQHGFLATP